MTVQYEKVFIMKNHSTSETTPAPSKRKTTIGGQALIEGLMMIGPDRKVMAVRKPDGTITVEELPTTRWTGLANWPFLRGSVRLFRQLVTGTKALLRSAELLDETAETTHQDPVDDGAMTPESSQPAQTPEKADRAKMSGFKARREAIGQKIDQYLTNHADVMLYISAIGGILFSVVLFILLPNLLASGINHFTGFAEGGGRLSSILMNLVEGAIRITIFVAYLMLASRMQEIQRVWMYHGAEHKTIACYEAELPLTVDNVRLFSRFHPRCGTSFMFIVILVSIVVFSLIGWWSPWINLLIRVVLVPVVAGIAYEIIRLAGRHDNRLTRAVSAPGLWLQRLTTAEPNDAMLEVAIVAMEAVVPKAEGRDKW
jgi:uncharacterized protein YqhQ